MVHLIIIYHGNFNAAEKSNARIKKANFFNAIHNGRDV